MKEYFIYIITNKKEGVLYIGITSNLKRRVSEHKNKTIKGFSSRYNLDKLVYYEVYNHIDDALAREKSMKAWKRSWKIKRIIGLNPEWKDLYYELNL